MNTLLDRMEDFLMATIFRYQAGVWLSLIVFMIIPLVSLIIRLANQ